MQFICYFLLKSRFPVHLNINQRKTAISEGCRQMREDHENLRKIYQNKDQRLTCGDSLALFQGAEQ